MSSTDAGLLLNAEAFRSLVVAKVFKEDTSTPFEKESLDFHESGDWCITTNGPGDTLQLYNCREGKLVRNLYSKKYGAALARFTHHKNCIVHASTKENDVIRYLSLHDNKYLQYFKGHKERVTGIEMAPLDDQFLSASSKEGIVRLWDLRSPSCQGQLKLDKPCCVAWEQGGEMFAVSKGNQEIRYFNLNSFDKGPFQTIPISEASSATSWTSLKFSNDGLNLMVTTDAEYHYLLDALTGAVRRKLQGHVPVVGGNGEEVSFTADGKYIFAGSSDGSICVWDVENGTADGQPLATLEAHTNPVRAVGWNPRLAMMVTACKEVAFWQPDEHFLRSH